MKRLSSACVAWAVVVSAALLGSSFADPYVFGFVTMGLGWLTAAVGLVGVTACLTSRRLGTRDRVLILGALVVAAAAIAMAVATLGTYKWA